MASLIDFLAGTKVLVEVVSPINGKLTVVRDIPWGTYIKGGGLTQSGGVAKKVWETSLRKTKQKKGEVKKALILGLGGGSIANLIGRFWGEVEIIGVDIDPVIVELGQKYLGMPEVETIIGDAVEVIRNTKYEIRDTKYDLICLDTYVEDQFPKKLESETFLRNVKGLLAKDGVLVVNRLYYGEKRKEAELFEKKLLKIFGKVERVYPEANVMFIVME